MCPQGQVPHDPCRVATGACTFARPVAAHPFAAHPFAFPFALPFTRPVASPDARAAARAVGGAVPRAAAPQEVGAVGLEDVRQQHHVPAHPGERVEQRQGAAAAAEGGGAREEAGVDRKVRRDDRYDEGASEGGQLHRDRRLPGRQAGARGRGGIEDSTQDMHMYFDSGRQAWSGVVPCLAADEGHVVVPYGLRDVWVCGMLGQLLSMSMGSAQGSTSAICRRHRMSSAGLHVLPVSRANSFSGERCMDSCRSRVMVQQQAMYHGSLADRRADIKGSEIVYSVSYAGYALAPPCPLHPVMVR